MTRPRQTIIYLAYACISLFACTNETEFEIKNDKIRSLIKVGSDSINAQAYFPDRDVRNYLHGEFNDFYKEREYNLAWLNFDEPEKWADELLEALDSAPEHGLRSESYETKKIEELLNSIYNIESQKEKRKKWRKKLIKTKKFKEKMREEDTVRFKDIAQLDFLLTASYLTYGSHLLSGRIDPNEKEEWFAPRRKNNLSEHLTNAIEQNDIKGSLHALEPSLKQYTLLQEYLIHIRKILNRPIAEIQQPLRPDDKSYEVVKAKKRLTFLKDIEISMNDSAFYDKSTIDAVRQFQHINGLEETGEIDQRTLSLLNKPLSYWIDKIETNMERMRWLQRDFEDEYILINIPAYELKVMRKNNVALSMKVIVGTRYKKTPVFSDTIEYVVFNPSWTVPTKIAIEDMLPRLKKEDDYLSTRNLRLYEGWSVNAKELQQKDVDWDCVDSSNWKYRIVQAPGPKNSLGRIKFMMPNSQFIYLHDTPAHHLFSLKERSFSHGCIRVEKPLELAELILNWDRKKTVRYLEAEITQSVVLKNKLPVHIVYWSAWVSEDGIINFRDDIYNHDQDQQKKIKQKEKIIAHVNEQD
ncbi:L,D-transpeptidase family protein [Fulvivirga sp. 29W222]|uniref:L,D-transpeptidase family protein n=1 Tax=Fulvivirga marina TaxID=2494733 RepID=A0A937FT90_9BACT|nr:L,D-transpeptidase family protein [Fulvivirga marina]MBL6445184.1 L,D-transpeptidase family protein [Fulvivirga marina]